MALGEKTGVVAFGAGINGSQIIGRISGISQKTVPFQDQEIFLSLDRRKCISVFVEAGLHPFHAQTAQIIFQIKIGRYFFTDFFHARQLKAMIFQTDIIVFCHDGIKLPVA